MRLLVAESEANFRTLICFALRADGSAVDEADNAHDAGVLAAVNDYDVVIMDVALPDRAGLQLIREMRRGGRLAPILIVSRITDKATIVSALDAGADDYLAHPVDFPEFAARVRALARRPRHLRVEQLRCGNVALDRVSRQALVEGQAIRLTRKELALLEQLLLHADGVLTRTELLDRVWEFERDPDSNVVDALVARLRAKLRAHHASARINTMWGIGFSLSAGRGAQPSATPPSSPHPEA